MNIGADELGLGRAEIEKDHAALAGLLEAGARICAQPVGARRCRECAAEVHQRCRAALHDLADRLQTLLLDHFTREDVLMSSLPTERDMQARCYRHRSDHVAFSTRYNKSIANLDATDVAAGIETVEALLIEWIRGHALRFDAELAAMLGRAGKEPG